MDDQQIIALFWQRSETAIAEAETAYGAMCQGIACRVLGNETDAMECVNDTWHALWNAIPPEKTSLTGPPTFGSTETEDS